MTATYTLSKTESKIFDLNFLRIDDIPDSMEDFKTKIKESRADIVRWKFPSKFMDFNNFMNIEGYQAELAYSIRHLLLDNHAPPSIKYKNDVQFIRYQGTKEDKFLLQEMIGRCYSKNALGVNSCPQASKLINDENQLKSMQLYFRENYIPKKNPDNHFYFVKKNNDPMAFCALSISSGIMYCPLGGVLPEHSKKGIFSDIMLFSRQLSQKIDVPKIHMGIRTDNETSMHVFMSHTYGDTGTVLHDWIDYVFYISKNK